MLKQLEGTLVYVMVDRGVDCWEKDKGQEWKAGVVITDEDVADAWDEQYPKQACKKVKASQFEEIYKCALPEGAEKNVWVITLKKNTKLANGKDVPDLYRPRVFEVDAEGNKTDITLTKLVGNGSKGILTIDHQELKLGTVGRLKNVFVTELIEYVRPEGSNYTPGDEVELPGTKSKSEVKETPAVKSTTKVAKTSGEKSPFDD